MPVMTYFHSFLDAILGIADDDENYLVLAEIVLALERNRQAASLQIY